ncbi:putative Glycosyl transferase group 1 [Nitrospira sp. KM1]|nr:putative Glycosyl transferase group 1 [Nitrospira sp. KM1]
MASSLDKTKYRSVVGLFRSGWLKDQCEGRGLKTYVLPSDGFLHWKWMRECYRLIGSEKVDLIQAHEFDAIVHGGIVSVLAGIPMVATVHGKNYFSDKARRRWAYRVLSRRARMVTVSGDLKRFVVEKVGISSDQVHVIHNGVEGMLVAGSFEIQQQRQDLGIPDEDVVVGVVGNLYPVKGHAYLLDAIPSILKVFPHTIFLLVGRGELEVHLKSQAHDLGIEKKVRFLGLRHDVPKLLEIMDLFVMPSLSEGLSIALLEAMAAGKPVIVTDVGGNPELVVQGKTGLIVPSKDSGALAAALTAMLTDRNRMKQFGSAGKHRVAEHFTVQSMIGNYQQTYASLVSGCNG